jgi:hypothetical protein
LEAEVARAREDGLVPACPEMTGRVVTSLRSARAGGPVGKAHDTVRIRLRVGERELNGIALVVEKPDPGAHDDWVDEEP